MSLEVTVESTSGCSRMLRLRSPRLVVVGYTGRDATAVARHVAELEAQGVPPPPEVPMFYLLPSFLLVSSGELIEVASASTCGEAEPVLIRLPSGELFVGIGSDHTDRELEKSSIHLSKAVCAKIVGPSVWPFAEVVECWDNLRLRSWAGEASPYQDDRLETIRRPVELLDRAEQLRPGADRPLVLFLGTVPLRSEGFQFVTHFSAILEDEARNRLLRCAYSVERVAAPALAEGSK